MELVLKVVLVGYVVYAVLGAPLLATGRGGGSRRVAR
ncbi:MAG: hypothetical protein JWM98_447 [Thermoleophilia bacterium]|nr:hypothetical protein [Thermoleophilia bacterium]